ncbi:hypothetical protein PF011_g11676 [Phytophthora fragariae]|uniref:Uncharacterized protein n=1 Tax=Phytophthora fragariae TaxID=53985 RepID=A0A6A3KFR8_9STRA|nr:hypothetical protein PF011_g11676 [Phytophthora fragariae]
MVSAEFEGQLASEGATGSAEAQLAFQEEFALAESVAAKRALVQQSFVPSSPDFWFYSALCTTLEVQTLVEEDKHKQAWQRLSESKGDLQKAERELTKSSCWRRAQRIERRRLMLELELTYKLKRSEEEVSNVTQRVTTALQVSHHDPEPAGVTTEARKETFPTALKAELLDLDTIIQNKLNMLRFSKVGDTGLKEILRDLDVFGREKVFQKVCAWDGPEFDHWRMLEVFLDSYAFEFADIPGYVDIIVKDVERKNETDKNYTFNYRAVHNMLSFQQLLECARKAPDLFRSNYEFAIRGVQLLRAAAEVDSAQCSDLRSETLNMKELQHIATYLEFLHDFTPTAVERIRVLIFYRKLELLNVICWTNPNAVTELLNSLVEYLKISGSPGLGASYGLEVYSGVCGFTSVSPASHKEIIRKSLKTLWASEIDSAAVFDALGAHLENDFLVDQHALTMIKLGKGEFAEWTTKLKDKGRELSSQASTSSVNFCESNPTYFLPEDPLRIYVRTRNVKSLTAHLFEIKTMEYYSRLRREIKGDICLDGLLPTEEQIIDLSHLTPWQETRIPIEFLATKNAQRGVFVVEVFEKGITCRAILRKGFLRHVERITTQGHEFTVLDEHGNLLREAQALVLNMKSGGSRAQHGREYSPDENGGINIPFRHPNEESSNDKFAIAFRLGSFGSFHGSFSYLAEAFDVDVDMHIDNEQLLPGFTAQLVTRPRLLCAGIATGEPLDLLVDVKLVIEFDLVNTSNVGSSSHKEALSFGNIKQLVNDPPSFEIPMDAKGFNVTLTARVLRRELGNMVETRDLPQVTDFKRFDVQRVNDFDGTYTGHLVRRPLQPENPYGPSEFRVFVLGHNGEPVPNVPANFIIKHVHSGEFIKSTLQADASGEINLGELRNVERLTVEFGSRNGSTKSCSWELPNLRSYRPQIVNCSVEEVVEIPIPFAFSSDVESWLQDKLVSFCEVVDTVLQNAAHCSDIEVIKNKRGYPVCVAVRIRQPGKYVVYLRPLGLKYPVTVCEKKNTQVSLPLGLIIQPAQVLLGTQTLPLTICSQDLKAEGKQKLVLEIQLRNASRNSTHVLVSLKHFLDMRSKKVSEVIVADGLKPSTSSGVCLPRLSFHSAPLENDFLKMRKISDEYAYILQRRALVSASQNSLLLLGSSSLPKPSLLQNPHVVGESDMEVVTVEAGDKVTGFKSVVKQGIQSVGSSRKMMMKKKRASRRSSGIHAELIPSISFIGQQSLVKASSDVSADGLVRVDLSGLPFFLHEMGSFEVCTIAFDSESGYVCTQELSMTLETSKFAIPKRDIRLSVEEALAPAEHFHQFDSHEVIRPGELKTLPRSFTSKYALYESLSSAINLWPTLARGSDVSGLAGKLKEWWSLSLKEKSNFYYKNACDDLHFFLFRKDPVFFKQTAEPLISAKICKSLMDYFVLGDEVSLRRFYLGTATFQRLSCIEKLLVAERITDTEEKVRICRAVIREIESAYPLGCSRVLADMFNTVLSQGQVEPSPAPLEGAPARAQNSFGGPPDASSRSRMLQRSCAPTAFGYSPTSPGYSPTSPVYYRDLAAAPMQSAPRGVAFGASATCASTPAFGAAQRVVETTKSCLEEFDDDFGVRSLDSDSGGSENDVEHDDDDDDSDGETVKKSKKRKQEVPYIPPGKVCKVQEKRYFTGQRPALTGLNMFWKQYAEHILRSQTGNGGRSRFVSSYFPEALVTLTEGLFALAVLDFDNESKPALVQLASTAGTHVTLSPTTDAILYHRSIGPAQCDPTVNTLILKQRIQDEDGDSNTELLVNTVYTTVVTLSNIGFENLTNVNLLLQIPQGALPMCSSGFYTKNEITNVAPNHTSEFKFSFYFPDEGLFAQYPARASVGGLVIGWAKVQDDATTCKVVRNATRVNLTSWADVSARGSLQEVVHFIESAKPGVKIDHQKLYWRCHDEGFYRGLVNHFRTKFFFVPGIWKYGLLHRDETAMKEFFASSKELAQSLGSGFRCYFVDEARLYRYERFESIFESFDYCEFGPFLTRRVHPVTGRVDAQMSWGAGATTKTAGKRILNAETRRYFGELCQRLGTHTRIDEQHLLVMAYYMILSDRIENGMEIFSRLESLPAKTELKSTVQYAYLSAFLDFFRSYGQQDRMFAFAHRAISSYATHPQPRWRERFQKMKEVLDEYDAFELQSLRRLEDMEVVDAAMETARSDDQDLTTKTTHGSQVKLEARVGDGAVEILSQSLGQCELAFYPIDVELMFSTEPFNTFSDSAASASSLLLVEPRQQQSISLNALSSENVLAKTVVQIPNELRAAQMMLRIREIASSRTKSSAAPPIDIIRPYFNSSLNVDIMTQCGVLQVLRDGLPVRSCYVKVYAKVSSTGRTKTEFYKDGYTDLLGKFDYVGINGDLITNVQKFSILISHDRFGATVEQVDPPVLASTVGDYSRKEERELLLY